MKKSTEIEIFTAIGIILFFAASFFFRSQIKIWIGKEIAIYGLILIFLISALLEFLPQYISPHMLLLQSVLLGVSLTKISGIVIIGSIVGSIVGFEIGKKFGKRVVRNLTSQKNYKKIKEKTEKHGKWVMALAAVSPLPYIPLVFGSLEIKRKEFIYYGVIPRTIGLIIFAMVMYFV